MISRFSVVPAIPVETSSVRSGFRYYCETAPIGFNLYDNVEKLRLKMTYQTREEAQAECHRMNLERAKATLCERESLPTISA
ncbi:hypothetical protein [Pseudomonas sp. NPDC089569]|uniref:hypothetical protein n=1 Tax=Pseudomonas sp. NPDC089569 TaxID=3390722 RepID=UPI003D0796A9